jgi:hypothetical protein
MEQEGKVSDKYTTEDMIAYVQRWKNCCASPYIDDESEADVQKCIDIERVLIARLQAADALVSAAKELGVGDVTIWSASTVIDTDKFVRLRKAIADYEEE